MTATVSRIHEHRCAYPIFVGGVWRSASACCWGQPLPIDPPQAKTRRAVA